VEEHRIQTARSLREALIKINDNLKKECVLQFSRQFLPIAFLEDSEKQFFDIRERIGRLEQRILEKCNQ
jgi:hypothetical protein